MFFKENLNNLEKTLKTSNIKTLKSLLCSTGRKGVIFVRLLHSGVFFKFYFPSQDIIERLEVEGSRRSKGLGQDGHGMVTVKEQKRFINCM